MLFEEFSEGYEMLNAIVILSYDYFWKCNVFLLLKNKEQEYQLQLLS